MNNYEYDEIGNLTKDNAEGITSIEWTVYGKIKTINKNGGVTVNYTYDASGNRISKTVQPSGNGQRTTFYVRDASGNVMAIYEKGNNEINSGKLSEIEVDLYGSSRLGMLQRNLDVESTNWWLFETTAMPGTNGGRMGVVTMGSTTYELTNHLGNVLVTISDRKIGVDNNSDGVIDYYTADVISANDFYPFGMMQPGRSYSAGNQYRYGFNGKENDNEVKGEGNQQDYGMRVYDPRVGRFLSVDPLTKSYPHYTPYSFAGNKPIRYIDIDGMEEGSSGIMIYDIQNWFSDRWDELTSKRRWEEAVVNVNRMGNPIYNATAAVVGEENLGIPSNMTPMTRGEATFNVVTQWMWWKYARIAAASNAPAQMEKQMTNLSLSTEAKPPVQKAALGLTDEEKQKVITWIKQQSSTGSPLKIPQGLTEEQFKVMSQRIANQTGNISTNVVVQGSRAAGTATVYSDIDVAIKVSGSQFDDLIKQAFGTPNPGSALERTMNHAIKTGKIQAGEAGLSGLSKNLQKFLGMDVDISIIKAGGQFDNGIQIPIQAAVPRGVK